MSNAGIPYTIPMELLPLDELRRVFEVNCVGLLAVTQVRTHTHVPLGVARDCGFGLWAVLVGAYACIHLLSIPNTNKHTHAQAFLPLLRRDQGRIVNVGSAAGFTTPPLYVRLRRR